MEGLSQRQNSILEYIQRFMRDSGYPPSIRDIQEKLKISSTSVVAYNLRKLEERGLISRDNRVSRGIKMPSDAEPAVATILASSRRVPLAGSIAAGQPIPVPDQGEIDDYVEVPAELAPELILAVLGRFGRSTQEADSAHAGDRV